MGNNNTITAKIKEQRDNGKNLSGRMEVTNTWNAVVCTKTGPVELVTVRCYMGRSNSASTVYSSIWVSDRKHGFYTSGRGDAGGYGYCKTSQAVGDAISSAGITLSRSIGGTGTDSIIYAIEAIVKALGYRGKCLVVRN